MSAHRRCGGYTLLELSLVLAISALVTAGVMLALEEPYRQARRGELVARLQSLDRQLRDRAARDGGTWQLVIDLRAGTLVGRPTAAQVDVPLAVALGRSLKVLEVHTAERRTSYGQVVIDYRAGGTSASFAVRFEEPLEAGSWFLVSGLSGKWEQFNDSQQVDQVLALTRLSTGTDTR